MTRFHYFNPGHETAILNTSPYYTPAANQLKMQRDLAFLPAWYSNSPEDFVLVEDLLSEEFTENIKNLPLAKAITKEQLNENHVILSNSEISLWGISPQSIHFFEILSKTSGIKFSIPEWNTEYKELSARHTAKTCLEYLIKSNPEISKDIIPEFYSKIEEIENLSLSSQYDLLSKAPHSSSGRGLVWLPAGTFARSEKQILQGIIKKQGNVSIEKVLNKQLDFAMLFYSDGSGNIKFSGFSVFNTNKKGAYENNVLSSQSRLSDIICNLIPSGLIEKTKQDIILFLKKTFGNKYQGCIGIDMMVYIQNNQFKLHPCVEINMRNSMGLLTLRLHQNFCDINSSGYFRIDFNNKDGHIHEKHKQMQSSSPIIIEKGKIISGYLSLCPVTENSKYIAYIIVNK